jgi:hypothetical protein
MCYPAICSAVLRPHVAKAVAALDTKALGGNGYSGEHFSRLACLILEGNGACSREEAEVQLGKLSAPDKTKAEQREEGHYVLENMVAARAVHLYPPSSVFDDTGRAARLQLSSSSGSSGITTLTSSLLSVASRTPPLSQPLSLFALQGRATAEGAVATSQGFLVTAPCAFELQLWRQREGQLRAMLWDASLDKFKVGLGYVGIIKVQTLSGAVQLRATLWEASLDRWRVGL